jgi:tetratricopeptide (TPR) repeat protein
MAEAYDVRAYPTYLMLNAEGQLLDRWLGYGKRRFLEHLTLALEDQTPMSARRTRYGAEPTAIDAARLGSFEAAYGEHLKAANYFRDAERLNQDPTRDYRLQVFESIADGLRDRTFTVDHLRRAAEAVVASPHCTPRALLRVAWTCVQVGVREGDPALVVAYMDRALEATAGGHDTDLELSRKILLVEHALHVARDSALAVTYKRETMPAGWMGRTAELNSFAWWCFENRVNLAEAEELARKAVGLAKQGKELAMVLDTLAEICAARGNGQEALALMEQAALQDPQEAHYARQLRRFRQLANGD